MKRVGSVWNDTRSLHQCIWQPLGFGCDFLNAHGPSVVELNMETFSIRLSYSTSTRVFRDSAKRGISTPIRISCVVKIGGYGSKNDGTSMGQHTQGSRGIATEGTNRPTGYRCSRIKRVSL